MDETESYEAEKEAADAIEVAIETALRSGGKWRDIRLLSCDPVSDSAMTVAKGGLLKRWRLDYMSLADEPQQAIVAPDLSPMVALPSACSPCRRRGQKAPKGLKWSLGGCLAQEGTSGMTTISVNLPDGAMQDNMVPLVGS